jgi:hypothetical protein
MTNRKSIEERIRDALASHADAISLSNQLFSPTGLFIQLAASEAERRTIVETPLFKEAQRRLSALKRKEAQQFARTVEQFEAERDGPQSLHRMERI